MIQSPAGCIQHPDLKLRSFLKGRGSRIYIRAHRARETNTELVLDRVKVEEGHASMGISRNLGLGAWASFYTGNGGLES